MSQPPSSSPSESNAERIVRFEEMAKSVRLNETQMRHLLSDVAELRETTTSVHKGLERLRQDIPPEPTDLLESINESLKKDRGDWTTVMDQLHQQHQGPGLADRFAHAVETLERRLIGGIEAREKASEQRLREADTRLAKAKAAEKRVLSKRALFWSERIGLVVVGLAIAAGIVAALAVEFPIWTGSQALRLDPAALENLLYCQEKAQGTPAGVICGDVTVRPF